MTHLSFECKSCGHALLVPVTPMIERYGGEITVDAVITNARCSLSGQKAFELRIVYRGGSYDALMGAANTEMNGEV